MKKEIPLLITFLLGAWMIFENFATMDWVRESRETLNNGGIIIMSFTYILGLYSLLHVNIH